MVLVYSFVDYTIEKRLPEGSLFEETKLKLFGG
jgi:hypothetical protein